MTLKNSQGKNHYISGQHKIILKFNAYKIVHDDDVDDDYKLGKNLKIQWTKHDNFFFFTTYMYTLLCVTLFYEYIEN